MKFKAQYARALQGDLGTYEVTFTTRDKEAVLSLKTQVKTTDLSVEVKKWREQRSVDANAYFHVLVTKIAERLGEGIDQVKRSLVCEYGTVAFMARIPATANLDNIYKYSMLIGPSKGTKEPCNDWMIFKPTHTHLTLPRWPDLSMAWCKRQSNLTSKQERHNNLPNLCRYGGLKNDRL